MTDWGMLYCSLLSRKVYPHGDRGLSYVEINADLTDYYEHIEEEEERQAYQQNRRHRHRDETRNRNQPQGCHTTEGYCESEKFRRISKFVKFL
jgi:hypothetical protein